MNDKVAAFAGKLVKRCGKMQVRQARETHAAQFNFDLQAIYRALKEQEEQSQRKKISFAPKRIPPVETEIKADLAT